MHNVGNLIASAFVEPLKEISFWAALGLLWYNLLCLVIILSLLSWECHYTNKVCMIHHSLPVSCPLLSILYPFHIQFVQATTGTRDFRDGSTVCSRTSKCSTLVEQMKKKFSILMFTFSKLSDDSQLILKNSHQITFMNWIEKIPIFVLAW